MALEINVLLVEDR